MNLESKYKSVFESHQSKVAPPVWSRIEARLDEKQTPNYWWWAAAAVIALGLFLGQINTTKTELREMAVQVQVKKIKTPQLSTTSTKHIIKHNKPNLVTQETQKPIQLSVATIQQINNPIVSQNIIGTPITQVMVKIHETKNTRQKQADNPIEGIIELASNFIRKKKKQINIPIIEIDYQSLLTLK